MSELSSSSGSKSDTLSPPMVSIVIPVRNEASHLGALLDDLLNQDYPAERYEILVTDGESTDRTKEVVENFARRARVRILCLPNPRRLSSAGRNVGVHASHGDIIVFIDGHCRVPNRSLLQTSADLIQQTGAGCLCRPQPLAAPDNSWFQQVVAQVRSTFLGHGPESTIYLKEFQGYVNPMSSGAIYKRSVFDQIGVFDESFDACEDVEFNYRVHKAGLRSYLSTSLAVVYRPRATPSALFKQLFRYGRGRFRFVLKHPGAASVMQLIPAAFVSWLIVGAAASFASSLAAKLYLASLVAYGVVVLWYSAGLGIRHGIRELAVAPLVYALLHTGLGSGFLAEGLKSLWAKPAAMLKSLPARRTPERAVRRSTGGKE